MVIDYPYLDIPDNNNKKEVVNLTKHYLDWIYDLFLEKINSFFIGELNDLCEDFELEPEVLQQSMRNNKIDNIYLLMIQEGYGTMIKIQLICKFSGMQKYDHLIEFVLPTFTNSNLLNLAYYNKVKTDPFKSIIKLTINDIYIYCENFNELLNGNLDSIQNRKKIINMNKNSSELIIHKFFNHIGRLQYLNYSFPFLVSENIISINNNYYVYNLIDLINELLLLLVLNKNKLCKYMYNKNTCTNREKYILIQSLISNYNIFIERKKIENKRFFLRQTIIYRGRKNKMLNNNLTQNNRSINKQTFKKHFKVYDDLYSELEKLK